MGIFSEKLEHAIENKHIEIYYQPIIRTLSGKLCSFEALARWEDPKLGILNPSLFISELEREHKIHILDCYMIDEICRRYKMRLEDKSAMVPVSFNLSRLDFSLCDIFNFIESTIRKYQVPREMFILEITESILEKNDASTKNIINKFHEAGYQVWMDDFGSGYSSLNVLKDYDFDEIKIDMEFLSVFNQKSKKIITSIVDMAKRIGIQTLAEGVENIEQLKFLTDIGCDKAQGYYFGKPMPYSDLMEHCISKNFIPETRPEAKFYQKTSSINFITDQAFGIVFQKSEHLEWKHLNREALDILNSLGSPTVGYSNKKLNSTDSTMYHIYRNMAKKAVASNHTESFSFPAKDSYIKVSVNCISSFENKHLFTIYLDMIQIDSVNSVQSYIDNYVKESVFLNDIIQIINIEEDWCETLMNAKMFPESKVPHFTGIQRMVNKLCTYSIYPDDKQRFQKMFDLRSLPDRLLGSDSGYLSSGFRILNTETGNYDKKLITITLVPHSNDKIFMIVIKDYIETSFQDKISEQEANHTASPFILSTDNLTYKDIFLSVLSELNVKCFFKDSNRRFTYVSDAFLKHYDIPSKEYVLGKTDEEMGWHPDSESFRRDELAVLKHGKTISRAQGSCIVKGVPHCISATKLPLYHDGKIVGLFGFFFDIDEITTPNSSNDFIRMTDSVTSLMNGSGFISNVLKLEEERSVHGTDYTIILIDIPEYHHILSVYGIETANHLLLKISQILRKHAGIKGILSRFLNAKFMIAIKYLSSEEIYNIINQITEEIHAIRKIDDYDCTLYAHYGIVLGSETDNIAQLPHLLEKRMRKHLDRDAVLKVFNGEKLLFERDKFDNLSDIVYLSDMDDYSLIYLNNAGRSACGLSPTASLEGKKCYEVIQGLHSPCEFCTNHLLRRNSFYEWNFHNEMTGKTYCLKDTLISSHGKKYRFEMAFDTTNLFEVQVKNEQIEDIEQFENDCIHIAMRESNPSIGLRRMIEKIGRTAEANCVHIFEIDEKGTYSTTYVWCKDGFSPSVTASDIRNLSGISSTNIYEPMIYNHKIIGYVLIENPIREFYEIGKNILSSLAQFIVMLLQNRNTLEKLEMQGRTDELTGVLNRRAFSEYKQFLEKQDNLLFVFCDINGLKQENDNFGHLAGDALIKNTAVVLREYFGAKNVFRMGGDEFLAFIILRDGITAEQIVCELREAYRKKEVSVAIGTAFSKDFKSDIEEILKIADQRMYQDKQRIHREQGH